MNEELEAPDAQTVISKLKLPIATPLLLWYHAMFFYTGIYAEAVCLCMCVCDYVCVYIGVIIREAGMNLSPTQPINSLYLHLPMKIT